MLIMNANRLLIVDFLVNLKRIYLRLRVFDGTVILIVMDLNDQPQIVRKSRFHISQFLVFFVLVIK